MRDLGLRDESKLHLVGAGVAVGLHLLIVAAVVVMGWVDGRRAQARGAKLGAEKFTTIEAGLAIKKKSAAGRKSSLPQKDVSRQVKPKTVGLATDPGATPSQPDRDEPYVPPDKIDPNAIFEKYRNVETGDTDSTAGAAGAGDVNQEGSSSGSEFGTLDQAKGDQYVGELIGRMTVDFTVPSVVTGTGLVTYGCVKLDGAGKIVDHAIDPEHKSGASAFDSAVEDRLVKTTDMEQPVPDHLASMLVGKFVCATYRY